MQLLVAMVMCILIYIISIRKEVSVQLFKQIGDKSFVYYIFHAVVLNCYKVYASLYPMLYCVLVFVSTGVLVSILIIPGLSEPPVRTLRATIPENESHIFR